MEIIFDPKKSLVSINFNNGKQANFVIETKAILNKIEILIEDLNLLNKNDETFDEYFYELYDKFSQKKYETSLFTKALEYSEKLVNLHNLDTNSFCDITKKTKNSIYFDIKDINDLLMSISILKIFGLFLYSQYKDNTQMFIDDLDNKYSDIMSKIYKIVKTRVLRGLTLNDMGIIKISMTMDYLVMYNFEFIYLTVLVFYNWKMNPLSFIVAVASDRTNFCIMTYNSVSFSYSSEITETNTEDFLDGVSYEIILDQINNKMNELLKTSNYKINFSGLYLTQLNSLIVLPLMSLITDINLRYLQQKSNLDKWNYQLMIYYIINESKYLKKLFGDSNKLFLYGYKKYTNNSSIIIPSILEVLKTEIKYYELNSKNLILDYAQELSTIISKINNLEHFIQGNQIPNSPTLIKKLGKDIIKFSICLFDEEIKEKIKEEGRELFLNFIGEMKVSNKTLSKLV